MTSNKIESLLAEVRLAIDYAREKIAKSPEGTLFSRYRYGAVRYYKRKQGETCGKYLGKDSGKTIRALEEKNYYAKLLETAAEEERKLLDIREKLKNLPDYNSVFLDIPAEKRHLIAPYEYVPQERDDGIVRFFNKKPVRSDLKLITQNGERVRSKSELIIADRLRAANVPYYYEDPLIMAEPKREDEFYAQSLYWHPDFKVQNVRTGKVYYWEHFGMLDNPEYCSTCQGKLETYAKYGYFPGENLIVTSESSAHGLNLEYIDCLIEKYLK